MNDQIRSILQRGARNRKTYHRRLEALRKDGKIDLDILFENANRQAFSRIDCLDCGNCCRVLGPRIRHGDLNIMSGAIGSNPSRFIETFLTTDEDGDMVFHTLPCPFLITDGRCRIYEARPRACREYPHMDNGRQSAMLRMHIRNLEFCPAVILAVESLIV